MATMNNLKCPFCGEKLKPYYGYGLELYSCSNLTCKGTYMQAEDSVWQELIRTRKALDFAKSKLNGIHRLYSHAFYHRDDWLAVCMEMVDKANTALDKITALTKGGDNEM